jgi:hypothetical protein
VRGGVREWDREVERGRKRDEGECDGEAERVRKSGIEKLREGEREERVGQRS